ncbi:MAG: hypothetical protein ABSA17_07850 [Rhabdochlamydiaceae bacterium]|jgi:hypothetical protein
MSVLKIGANSVLPTAAGTTAPATTDKRTTRIANGILRFFKATESGPIRQSVTVGFGVGVFFLGIGGVFGALVGFIHGIFASIKLHNLRVKVKREEFQNLKARVDQAIQNGKPISATEAKALIKEIRTFYYQYNELCIFGDDEMDMEISSLSDKLQNFRENEKKKYQLLKARVEYSIKDDYPFSAAGAIALIKEINEFHGKYNELCIYNDYEIGTKISLLNDSIVKRINKDEQAQIQYNNKLRLVTERVEKSTKDETVTLTPQMANTMVSELELLDKFALLGISVDVNKIGQLKKSIKTFIQKQAEKEINICARQIYTLENIYQKSWKPEFLDKALMLKEQIKRALTIYGHFLTSHIKRNTNELLTHLNAIIKYGNEKTY